MRRVEAHRKKLRRLRSPSASESIPVVSPFFGNLSLIAKSERKSETPFFRASSILWGRHRETLSRAQAPFLRRVFRFKFRSSTRTRAPRRILQAFCARVHASLFATSISHKLRDKESRRHRRFRKCSFSSAIIAVPGGDCGWYIYNVYL